MEYHFTPLDAHGAKFMCVCVCVHFCLTPSAECVFAYLKMGYVCLCLPFHLNVWMSVEVGAALIG